MVIYTTGPLLRPIWVPLPTPYLLLLAEQEFTAGTRCGKAWRRRQASRRADRSRRPTIQTGTDMHMARIPVLGDDRLIRQVVWDFLEVADPAVAETVELGAVTK